MAEGTLNVIALVSGGKDSFFSILHCLANGHRVVALANLYPQSPSASTGPAAAVAIRDPSHDTPSQQHEGEGEDEADLNSFMYQTVGHQVIPLYAQATGLPLFRHPIVGGAVHHGLNYQVPQGRKEPKVAGVTVTDGSTAVHQSHLDTQEQQQQQQDETESLVPLLRAVLAAHPEANALSTGAILSTYQRTRVESVALRLGLVPLSYLWQYTELPLDRGNNNVTGNAGKSTGHQGQHQLHPPQKGASAGRSDDAQLLRDMEAVGLDARIVKVASAGLDESFLWENVASDAGVRRVERGMRRFGGGGRGSVLGEGGEFETLVVDGPPSLFKGGRIVVREESKRVVQEGGGSVWLSIRDAAVEARNGVSREAADAKEEDVKSDVRIPGFLDPRFEVTLEALLARVELVKSGHDAAQLEDAQPQLPPLGLAAASDSAQQWCFVARNGDQDQASVEAQTARAVADIRLRLREHALPASAITNAIIILRHMSDFPTINKLYGSLFDEPNPPARVTISCGDALPKGCSIAVYLTVYAHSHNDNRLGLHVQSRSYWAPANIGPYSQAISVPLLTPPPPTPYGADDDDGQEDHYEAQLYSSIDSNLAVSIAGQIPLIPVSMALPDVGNGNLALQTTLALQHLWRVAAAVDVQWWTSAVAYFPRASPSLAADDNDVRRKTAQLAAAAWHSAHLWAPIREDKGIDGDGACCGAGGPDVWDRRFNSAYQSFGDEEANRTPAVPSWKVVAGFEGDEDEDDYEDMDGDEDNAVTALRQEKKRRCVPFFFAAEVDELPRQAGIEWHAHLGLAKLQPGSVRVLSRAHVRSPGSPSSSARVLELQHVVAETPNGVFVQSAVAVPLGEGPKGRGDGGQDLETTILDLQREVVSSLAAATSLDAASSGDQLSRFADATSLHLVYVDVEAFSPTAPSLPQQPAIPCRSLWDSCGDRLALVVLFQSWFLPVR